MLMLQCCVRLSVVCNRNVCIVAKRCVLPKNYLKKQIGNGLWGVEWRRNECSRARWRNVNLKGQGRRYTSLSRKWLETSYNGH